MAETGRSSTTKSGLKFCDIDLTNVDIYTLERKLLSLAFRNGNGCLIWFGKKDKDGYPTATVKGKKIRVTRLLLKLRGLDITKGLAAHSCDTPSCIEDKHLSLGTHVSNMQDAAKKFRLPAVEAKRSKQFCPKGHPYNEENTIIRRTKTGFGRWCRTCEQIHNRTYKK